MRLFGILGCSWSPCSMPQTSRSVPQLFSVCSAFTRALHDVCCLYSSPFNSFKTLPPSI